MIPQQVKNIFISSHQRWRGSITVKRMTRMLRFPLSLPWTWGRNGICCWMTSLAGWKWASGSTRGGEIGTKLPWLRFWARVARLLLEGTKFRGLFIRSHWQITACHVSIILDLQLKCCFSCSPLILKFITLERRRNCTIDVFRYK